MTRAQLVSLVAAIIKAGYQAEPDGPGCTVRDAVEIACEMVDVVDEYEFD